MWDEVRRPWSLHSPERTITSQLFCPSPVTMRYPECRTWAWSYLFSMVLFKSYLILASTSHQLPFQNKSYLPTSVKETKNPFENIFFLISTPWALEVSPGTGMY